MNPDVFILEISVTNLRNFMWAKILVQTQCEYFRTFLSLRFYVKSIFENLKCLKLPFWKFLRENTVLIFGLFLQSRRSKFFHLVFFQPFGIFFSWNRRRRAVYFQLVFSSQLEINFSKKWVHILGLLHLFLRETVVVK